MNGRRCRHGDGRCDRAGRRLGLFAHRRQTHRRGGRKRGGHCIRRGWAIETGAGANDGQRTGGRGTALTGRRQQQTRAAIGRRLDADRRGRRTHQRVATQIVAGRTGDLAGRADANDHGGRGRRLVGDGRTVGVGVGVGIGARVRGWRRLHGGREAGLVRGRAAIRRGRRQRRDTHHAALARLASGRGRRRRRRGLVGTDNVTVLVVLNVGVGAAAAFGRLRRRCAGVLAVRCARVGARGCGCSRCRRCRRCLVVVPIRRVR